MVPKFSFSSEKNPKITPHETVAVHSITTKMTNQKTLRQAVQLPLNYHAPDLHTVAPGLRTVVFPPVALRSIDHHQLRIQYSLIRLSSFWTSVWNPLNQKTNIKMSLGSSPTL